MVLSGITDNVEAYLRFLRYCLSENEEVPRVVAEMDWRGLLAFARKHAIVGIVARTLLHDQKIGSSAAFAVNKLTEDDVMDWMGEEVMIRQNNEKCDDVACWAINNFRRTGFDTCILKGQGAALLYPESQTRTSGDVDVWVRPSRADAQGNGKRDVLAQQAMDVERVLAECRQFVLSAKACYHHVDFLSKKNIPIEVHYRPQWLNNPWHNRNLQRFFMNKADRQFAHQVTLPNGGQVAIPTAEFNVIFMLSHIYNHLLHEGVGLRQLVDYYYLLRSVDWMEWQRSDLNKTMADCGLVRIGQAVSWVLSTIFGLEESHLLVEPSERYGQIVLREVLAGGNFGKHDDRVLSGAYHSPVRANLQRLVRDVRMVWYFPSECLWEPWFRVYHWWWRKQHQGIR